MSGQFTDRARKCMQAALIWVHERSGGLSMFERFTDRARKVMTLANKNARRFDHEYIGTEHILLGLVEEGEGVAANVLKNMDVDLRKVRQEVEKIVQYGSGDLTEYGKLPQTPRSKKVIEYAIQEARDLGHNYVGSEHLLLGLLRECDGVAAQVLMNLGLTLDGVRQEVLNILGQNPLMSPGSRTKKIEPEDAKMENPAKLDRENAGQWMEMFGPAQIDQQIRMAIQFCWMGLPKERRTLDEVEVQIRRLLDRAMRDFREDSQQFGANGP
jgi:ATP-dependent Clp protease ATP-binding subunit ClpA